ncbi:unnamed protein product [Haemonchus placei]|uniref:DDE_Tnp_1 domain-containing protein n=1 Tax=Haemonchus placei TaxID=6290 RepID=A0A0N4VUL8_HAEPC|nr:unnamed protein product [Haemonchus placei]
MEGNSGFEYGPFIRFQRVPMPLLLPLDRSGAPGQRSYRRVQLEGELFQGVVETSKQGVHPVVNGSNLVGDPVLLPHVCLPKKNAQERVERVVYKSCHEIAEDARLGRVKPRELWQNIADKVHYNEPAGEAERDQMLLHFYKDGYASRRYSIARAVRKHHDARVTMENVPREYAFLPDGSAFLQHRSADMHIYYSAEVLEKACQLNLSALVADGVHDLQPDATNKTGQLYVIHGVMADSVDVPLLFAITKRDMWYKWDVRELRTTNIAESFNRLLGVRLGVKYPRMSDLLFALRGCVTTAKGALLNLETRRQAKRLHKKDILRRRRIEREMARFKSILDRTRNFPRTSTITTYCRRMSRFVTEKVV